MTAYPEHEKLKALKGANETVADFLDWLGESGLIICTDDSGHWEGDPTYSPFLQAKSTIIAQFLKIDERRLDAEKRQMLSAEHKS